ncbi:methyltransferase domain-containing protein [Streptomyces adustus]|uniref:Methyltransferase domain-containing protein n=1 Tax=Streptomyces adustus TaxID=1609272 RepID=A0A5N8V7K6_9ACTN|nr:methyltransferase domain-containing protein [Streptomyces adustus]MPY31147.1 methyltransferase domain-containing protein [Streptomyces adustus]
MTRKSEQDRQSVDEFVAVLDAAEQTPGAMELRQYSYQLLRMEPGASAVDVGCGTGRAVAELRDLGVKAVGIDPAEQMIAIARRRWSEADFRVAGANELPFADGSMSGYRADKVFHELPAPRRALKEARRVLVRGGRIALIGQDWDTVVVDSDDPALTRAIVHARADQVAAPRAARRYRNLLLDTGFIDVAVQVRTGIFTGTAALPLLTGLAEGARLSGAVPDDRADAWLAKQRARAEADRLFLALPLFVASATASC